MLVDAARGAAAARYGAIGVPDGEGGFARFVTSGMSEEEIARIGPLPRTHGLLAAMLESPAPERMADIRHDPRYRWWPSAHPVMTSFLGVPILAGGEIVGAFYLVNKEGGGEFSQDDEDAIRLLAAHAAIAIEHAAAGERSRELSVVEERNRLARELHDSVNQTLWGAVLTAEAATELLGTDPAGAAVEVARVRDLPGRRSSSSAPSSSSCARRTSLRMGLQARSRSTWTFCARCTTRRSATRRRPSRCCVRGPSGRCSGSPRRRSRTPSGTRRRARSTCASRTTTT